MHRVEYLLWLKQMGLSSRGKFLDALEYFSSPEELYNATEEALSECGMFTEEEKRYLLLKDMRPVAEEIERCNKAQTYLVDYYSRAYPARLRDLADPPLVLYVKGNKAALMSPCVTVVGSRRADSYGLTVAQDIGGALSQQGCAVVSGMAQGIDQAAILGAVHSGGIAIGVLCCGMDVDYPSGSEGLRGKVIASGGAIISEFPFGTESRSGYFPVRNRLMAALSDVTCVVQAGEKSGALLTARAAEKLGRTVYAVPGRIDLEESRGVNALLSEGAKMVTDPAVFAMEASEQRKKEAEGEAQKEKPVAEKKTSGKKAVSDGQTESDNMVALYALLKDGPAALETLAEKSGRSIKWVASTLIIAEVSGKVKVNADGLWQLLD